MRRYTHEDTPGLPDNQIRSLLMDRAGNLWIGSATGLAHAAGRHHRGVPVRDDAAGNWSDAVLALGENSRGQIAFGTLKSGIGIVDAQADSGRIVACAASRTCRPIWCWRWRKPCPASGGPPPTAAA
jgi:ligand-binding sensor domain-containing protein